MANSKTITVADTIHGSVQISILEKQMISTQLFNRLHNIMQNSTAYLTYPSNKTRRFEHSLGVMHLAGKMFYQSITNADEKTRDDFLDSINLQVDQFKSSEYAETFRGLLGDKKSNLINEYQSINIEDSLYKLNTPNVIKTHHLFSYTILYQAVRTAALLHDIGHPPFSHITEFALEEVWSYINKKPSDERDDVHEEFMEITKYSLEAKVALHEHIGDRLSDRLLEDISKNFEFNQDVELILFYWIHRKFVKYIFKEQDIFKDVHHIVAHSIDSDRLDYITRDFKNSGFDVGKIEYDRLISSMKLVHYENEFFFAPSIKTLSTVEDFFQRRWLLYKNVIFHHRIIKTDYILGRAIVALSKEVLNQQHASEEVILPFNISGLWKAIKDVHSNEVYFNNIIQWDDSWLTTVLRRHYFKEYLPVESPEDNMDKYVVKIQLEELLSNKKNYLSMVKGTDDFIIIDNTIFSFLNEKINYDLLEEKVGVNYSYLLGPLKNHNVIENGLFIFKVARLIETINDLFVDHLDKMRTIQQLIKACVEAVARDQFEVVDSFVVFKKMKTGLEDGFPLLHRDMEEPVFLDSVSRIYSDLRQNQALFPFFFIYINCSKHIDKKVFLETVGENIAKELEILFQQFYDPQLKGSE